MQYIDCLTPLDIFPAAVNDNDDLLAIESPQCNLAFIRSMKQEMLEENAEDGLLLRSRRKRKFFQEVTDAERYILMRYFSAAYDVQYMSKLKRHILDRYLFPK